jgi:hypothetical protein
MNISELLNPVNEAHGMDTVTDKDIFNAVVEARKEQEAGKHGNTDDTTGKVDTEPTPTHTEVIQVTLMLGHFTKDKNDPFLQELESTLVSFRKWTQADSLKKMVDSKLTSYFT